MRPEINVTYKQWNKIVTTKIRPAQLKKMRDLGEERSSLISSPVYFISSILDCKMVAIVPAIMRISAGKSYLQMYTSPRMRIARI